MAKQPSEIIVETYTMGTLRGDAFLVLQEIFQMAGGDMYGVDPDQVPHEVKQILVDRGFAKVEKIHSSYYMIPTDQSYHTFYLELGNGWRVMEPRDPSDGRLVVRIPEWAEYQPALGVPQL